MRQLVIFSLEPIETRYTKQWFTYLPKYFKEHLDCEVLQINGNANSSGTSEGAFLDFADTNIWKSEQVTNFFKLFQAGDIAKDAVILITDFWNPVVNMLRYTNDLLEQNWKIVAFAHAGMYDPQDFLGRKFKDRTWGKHAELSFFEACDKVVFATDFHRDLFLESYPEASREKILRSGMPFGFLKDEIVPLEKEDLILFPHRLAPEKQHDIFVGLSKLLPQYTFVTCQELHLNKGEYHNLLGRAKMVFSANLQETLGISTCAESLCAGALPLAPDNLSYEEILPMSCKYPHEFIAPGANLENNLQFVASYIEQDMENYKELIDLVDKEHILSTYFDAPVLIEYLKGC